MADPFTQGFGRMMADGGMAAGGDTRSTGEQNRNGQTIRLLRQFKHGDGNDYMRVPPSWRFPKLALQAMYSYWHCGNKVNNIPLMRFLEHQDLKHLGARAPPTHGGIR